MQTRWTLFSPHNLVKDVFCDKRKTVALILFWIVAAFALAIRIRLLSIPLERDEGEYAYAGQLMLQGIPPYKLAYNMKFPGTYAVYALIMAIFGQSASGIHLGLLFTNIVTIAFLFLLGKRLLNYAAGITAATTFAILSLSPSVLGLAAHATHFIILFVVAGVILLLSRPSPQPWSIFASGLLFGLALLMKQPAFFLVLFGAGYLLFSDLGAKVGLRRAILRNLMFISGAAFPWIVACRLLLHAGVFQQFWFWTIKYAAEYATAVPLAAATHILTASLPQVIRATWLIWLFALLGLLGCVFDSAMRDKLPLLLGWLVFAALAVSSGFYFRPHYFVLLLPVLSLFVGIAVNRATDLLCQHAKTLSFIPALAFCCALGIFVLGEREVLIRSSPIEVSRLLYWGNAFPECARVADYIRDHSSPTDTIAVLGSEPEIYFYSHRHSATGYIYTYALMEPQKYAHDMQAEMIREIERAQPRFLVSVSNQQSWLRRPDSDQLIFAWANRYMAANYAAVALVNIVSPDRVEYYFSEVPQSVQKLGDYILVYERKSQIAM